MSDIQSLQNLRRALYPKTIAVVGASTDERKYGYIIPKCLIEDGFKGELVLVNPKGGTAFNRPFFQTIQASGKSPDLVVTALPADRLTGVIDDCARAGAGGVVLFTAGLAETGEVGAALQDALVRRAAQADVRLIGPNCLGVVNADARVNVMGLTNLPSGQIGLVSQSGTIADIFFKEGRRLGGGLSLCVSLGNQADVQIGEVIEIMTEDESTKVIVAYIEGVRDGHAFLSAVRRAATRKPVVVIKGGRTSAGARSAVSHTASLAGSAEAYSSILQSAGAILVEDLQDLYPVALTLSKAPLARGAGVAVIGGGGGLATLSADALERRGLVVPRFSADVQAKFKNILIPRSSVNNPIEFAGAFEEGSFAVYRESVELAMQQDNIDAVMVYGYFGGYRPDLEKGENSYTAAARALCSLVTRYGKPLVLQSIHADDPFPSLELLKSGGIPVFRQPETAARAVAALVEAGRTLSRAGRSVFQEPVSANEAALAAKGPKALPFSDAAALARAHGIAVSPLAEVADVETAVQEAGRAGYPVVLKLVRPVVPHKTEVGGVAANITNEAQLCGAVERMLADPRIPAPPTERRLGIGPMVRSGVEAVVGALRDPTFGPIVMVGSGGIFVELFRDVAFDLAGLDQAAAERLIKRTKLAQLLGGARGRDVISLHPLCRTILAVSDLMLANPKVAEIDLNPIFIGPASAIAADVRIVQQ